MPKTTEYRQSVDLGGQNERSSAIITVEGGDERVKELLAMLHPFLANARAQIMEGRRQAEIMPCKGCGDK